MVIRLTTVLSSSSITTTIVASSADISTVVTVVSTICGVGYEGFCCFGYESLELLAGAQGRFSFSEQCQGLMEING